MNKYQETFRTWDKIAGLYEEKFMDLAIYNEAYDFFLEALPGEEASILEVGCGPGNITKYLLRKKSGLKILGTDISPNMVEAAARNNPSADFIVSDIRDIHKIEAKFDAILAGFVLPYLSREDISEFIKNSSSALLESGLIYLSFVEGDYANSGFISGSSGDRVYFYYHSEDFMRTQVQAEGFNILKSFVVKYPRAKGATELHKVIIAKK